MAYTSSQRRPAGTSAPGDGSRTITITGAPPGEEDRDAGGPSSNPENSIVGALRLTGGTRRSRPRVAWDEGVVDNEGCGRKSSKICCIYHKPKRFDESSDEDSSDSDSGSDSDSSCDDGRARRSHQHQHHNHSHHRPSDDGAGAGAVRDPGSSAVTQLEEPSRHNTYETVPYGKKASGKGKRKSG